MNAAAALPSIFVSHGSPMIALEPGETGAFFARLGPAIDATFGRPRAVLVLSAHTLARQPVWLAASRHDTVHDFGGFPPALYELRYDAPGAPELAHVAQATLAGAGFASTLLDRGGLDHGIWTVLRFMYPRADMPVLPLAIVPEATPEALFALGAALAPLRAQGVLVLGTGSMTHNLRLAFAARPAPGPGRHASDTAAGGHEMPESRAFRDWFAERSAARDWEALFAYRGRAPHAVLMHPTDEHLLPWYPAAGAGGRDAVALRLHDAVTLGCLGMDCYAFGSEAGALRSALT